MPLTETEVRSKLIDPALKKAGWNLDTQVAMEYYVNDGRVEVKNGKGTRGKKQFVDYLLCIRRNIPIALIEAKEELHSVGSGMQQGIGYAKLLDLPMVFSSNGKGFLFRDNTKPGGPVETEIRMDEMPSPEALWEKFKFCRGITPEIEETILQEYYLDTSGRKPRYYQTLAINKTVAAVAKGEDRMLIVMATGTGKTFTAFNIIYRLWKAGVKKRILFLADRVALIDQTRRGDFRHFKDKMTILKKTVVGFVDEEGKAGTKLVGNNRRGISAADKAYEIFLGIYQGLTSSNGPSAYKDFSRDFFDLIVIDECHRGSARADSEWREVLEYFSSATQIGLTATPKETKTVSNMDYFGGGDPIYTYTLAQGIDDGYLSPYRVLRVTLNVDAEDYIPERGKRDKYGKKLENRAYGIKDFDRLLVIDERTEQVAKAITAYLKRTNRYQKTIVFCVDIDHAERLRQAIANENRDLVALDDRYVLRMTGDSDKKDKDELDSFTNPEENYPVIVTTSKLLTTGIDAKTCQLIVLDNLVESMTEFKQTIGRGTRIDEEYGKLFFTIIDFRKRTKLFADDKFDGPAEKILEVRQGEVAAAADALNSDDADAKPEKAEDPPPTNEQGNWRSVIRQPDISLLPEEDRKRYVNGVDVRILSEREIMFDQNGRIVTLNLRDYSKERVLDKYPSLEAFLQRWNSAERKMAIVDELVEHQLPLAQLRAAVGDADVDSFDLICHVAYDQPPLTRSQRAKVVRESNYFEQYGHQARRVLLSLLGKYAAEGLDNLEDIKVLKLDPFREIGSLTEIVGYFGGKDGYLKAIKDLEKNLYAAVA